MSEEVTYACASCGTETSDRTNLTEIDESLYCDTCSRLCDRCGDRTGDDYYYIEGIEESWCESCAMDNSSYCERCDARYDDRRVSIYTINDTDETMCEYCASNNYMWCDDHNAYYDDECYECGCDPRSNIHDYSYKPDPEFIGTDKHNLYFGIEVETEVWGDLGEAARAIGMETSFYLKNDSSIGANTKRKGFEVVSHPHTLDAWMSPDNPMLRYLEDIRRNFTARSWDAESSCGLHIHISRAGFGSGAHTHRFLSLVYSNAIEMSKLGGRKGSSYAKFSDVYKFDDYGRPYRDFRDKIHNFRMTERYSAVNTLNRETLELRWFQGTLKRDGILANIQLAHAMVEYTRYLTVAQVREGALRWDRFAHWVASVGTYPQLADKIARLDSVSLSVKPTLNA